MRKYKGKYRSKFEETIAEWLQTRKIPFKYEPFEIPYIVPESKHKYTPDWRIGDDNTVIIESKGRLTAIDRRKLLHIRASNPDLTIRILLMNSDVKIRKGSPTSYGDWCEKNNFEYADFRQGVPKKWLQT